MLRVCLAERKVTALGIRRSKGKENILACAIVDARGLKKQTVRRIQEDGENSDGGKTSRQVDIRKSGGKDTCCDEKREDDPHRQQVAALARFFYTLTGKPSLTPRA